MNETKADEIRSAVAALLAFVISASGIVAVGIYFFLFGSPDGSPRTPLIEFFLPATAVFLVVTFIGAAVAASLWRAAPVWPSLIAASPYLLLAVSGRGIIWLGAALFTFGAHYVAVRLHKASPESNVA